jgi:glycosyltransferase involved in cell wall biosynthesis
MAPTYTVIVCTRNRAAMLRRCFEALAGVDFPRTQFEVLAVDNASTDATGKLIA